VYRQFTNLRKRQNFKNGNIDRFIFHTDKINTFVASDTSIAKPSDDDKNFDNKINIIVIFLLLSNLVFFTRIEEVPLHSNQALISKWGRNKEQ